MTVAALLVDRGDRSRQPLHIPRCAIHPLARLPDGRAIFRARLGGGGRDLPGHRVGGERHGGTASERVNRVSHLFEKVRDFAKRFAIVGHFLPFGDKAAKKGF